MIMIDDLLDETKPLTMEDRIFLHKRLTDLKREITDRDYMITVLVNWLGPKGLEAWKLITDSGASRVHFSWGPDAADLTGEERAAENIKWYEAIKSGLTTQLNFNDSKV